MYRDISERDLADYGQHRFIALKDRRDLYRAVGHTYRMDAMMGIRVYYECVEVNCNPDFDW
jgi:hypothetical protein